MKILLRKLLFNAASELLHSYDEASLCMKSPHSLSEKEKKIDENYKSLSNNFEANNLASLESKIHFKEKQSRVTCLKASRVHIVFAYPRSIAGR